MTKAKKAKAEWVRPDLLRVEEKRPEVAYKWAREDNVERLKEEGWVASEDSRLATERVEGDGAKLDSTIRRRELVLMEMPAEMAEARQTYWRSKAEEQAKAIRERYLEEAERRGFPVHQHFDRR